MIKAFKKYLVRRRWYRVLALAEKAQKAGALLHALVYFMAHRNKAHKHTPRVIALTGSKLVLSELRKQHDLHVLYIGGVSTEMKYANDFIHLPHFDQIERVDLDKLLADIRCKGRFDHVLVGVGERSLPLATFLGNALGLEKKYTQLGTDVSLSKSRMRAVLESSKFNGVRSWDIKSPEELGQIAADCRLPLILKPAIGEGANGIIRINSLEELEHGYQYTRDAIGTGYSDQNFVVAEEFIEGRQFDVEGVVNQGHVFINCIVEEDYQACPPHFTPTWFVFNPNLSEAYRSRIIEHVKSVLSACMITHGAFMCELKVTEEGEIRVLDIANRMGFGFEYLIQRATGIGIIDCYLDSVLFGTLPDSHPQERQIVQVYLYHQDDRSFWQDKLTLLGLEFQITDFYHRAYGQVLSFGTIDILVGSEAEVSECKSIATERARRAVLGSSV